MSLCRGISPGVSGKLRLLISPFFTAWYACRDSPYCFSIVSRLLTAAQPSLPACPPLSTSYRTDSASVCALCKRSLPPPCVDIPSEVRVAECVANVKKRDSASLQAQRTSAPSWRLTPALEVPLSLCFSYLISASTCRYTSIYRLGVLRMTPLDAQLFVSF